MCQQRNKNYFFGLLIQSEYDEGRTAELERLGITVLRFQNEVIMQNIDYVIDTIQSIVLSLQDNCKE